METMITQFLLTIVVTCLASVVHTMSLDSLVLHSGDQVKARHDMMDKNPLFWSQYLAPNRKEYLLVQKRATVAGQKACRPVLTALSTFTHEHGIQTPKTIFTSRCQGGVKNPENYQCQPSNMVIECFHLRNEQGNSDFLGVYSHESCQERCVCGRKSCKNKPIYNLICPKGYEEDKNTCQCNSMVGQSIFYRTLGLIADWDKNLHNICRSKSQDHKTSVGKSFKLKPV